MLFLTAYGTWTTIGSGCAIGSTPSLDGGGGSVWPDGKQSFWCFDLARGGPERLITIRPTEKIEILNRGEPPA
jgi:hypothetical protein